MKVVKTLIKDAGIPGYFTNHSTRRTGGTRLFRVGVQRKLVKEETGHRSDAIDKYQITSDKQREMLSAIIARRPDEEVCEKEVKNVENEVETGDCKIESKPKSNGNVTCQCQKNQINENNMGDIVKGILSEAKSDGKL